jgi:hypothetical protein
MSVGVVSAATRSQYATASAARPLACCQPSRISAAAHPLRHRQLVQPLLGGVQQRRGAAHPPLRREVHIGQRPHPQRQVGTRRGCHCVQRGRGNTRRPQPRHRRDGGDRAAARQDRHQQGRPPSGVPSKVNGQQPWGCQPVRFGQRQGCRLGGEPLAAGGVGVADAQDRLDRLAAMVDAKPPGPCASPQSHDRHDPGAGAHLVGRPPQHRLDRPRHTHSLTEPTVNPNGTTKGTRRPVQGAAGPVGGVAGQLGPVQCHGADLDHPGGRTV